MALSGNVQLKLAGRTLDRHITDARRGRRVLRRLVIGRTSHPFDEEMVYQYTIGETDDDDAATYILRTIAKDEAGPGVFWRTLKFKSMNPHAQKALKDGRVALSVDYVGEPPWKGPLEWVQTNEEAVVPNDEAIDVVVVFPQAIPPGAELAWRVEVQWPGCHYNIRYNNGLDRMVITLARPRRRLEFVLRLPPLAKSARFNRKPDHGGVVRSDKEVLHWQSHSPAPAGEYFWETQIDREGPWL